GLRMGFYGQRLAVLLKIKQNTSSISNYHQVKYLKILYVQVLIAIFIGVLVGYSFPGFAPTAKLISDIFINMIRMIITPVIFISIVLGIANAGDLRKVGKVGLKGIIYFEVV